MPDPYKTRKLYGHTGEARSQWEPLPVEPFAAPPRQRIGLGQILLRGVLLGLLAVASLGLLGSAAGLSVYAYYARQLPSPEELYARTTEFKSTKILDRHGRLLYEIIDPLGGKRIIVRFTDLPSVLIEATIATEDPTFFTNLGVSPTGIARALYQDLKHGDRRQGGSTITQQLVKNLFLTPEKTYKRKIQEAILATEITRRYSKADILEVYLNEIYLGNLAYGLGAAAETYFGKQAAQLDLAESALLVGMIQSPAIYDPYIDPDAALARRATILDLMLRRGYITRQERDAAADQPLGVVPHDIVMQAPHMVTTVREQLEYLYGTEMLYKGGLQVYTTLDLDLQHLAEDVAREKIALLKERQASNAALVAIDPNSGQVLAMLGSVDFYDESISGQVNVARRLRQPGSTIKPFTYLAAMERGWTAGTMIMDVEQAFPDGLNPPYKPHNYDETEWGPLSLRTALACSRNIPAVSTLHQIGLPALLEVSHRLGIHSLNRPDYGLSLTLGGGDVTLLEMTAAYGSLANGGRRVDPQFILYIEDQAGETIQERARPELPQVLDARHAYILTDILSDRETRARTFGHDNALELPFTAAAKTGTTNDYRDSWTVGYAPDLVVGVWVGNSDNSPMDRLTGSRGAAPIWHDFLERALADSPHPEFQRPDGIVEVQVCPISGLRHTENCPPPRTELFLSETVPGECSVHQRLRVCQVTGKLATDYCPEERVEEKRFEDYGPAWDEWAREQGIETPPRQVCDLHTSPTHVTIELPPAPLSGVIMVRGYSEAPDFRSYVVEYGKGSDPEGWKAISPEIKAPVYDGTLCQWDTRKVENGSYTVRLLVRDHHGQTYEARAVSEVHNVEPTATTTPRPTATATAAATDTPATSSTPAPSATATRPPSATPSRTPLHTRTATPTRTPLYTKTATATRTPTSPPTMEPTNTATIHPTATSEPSPTATQTLAPSASATPPPTDTPTATPMPSATATPQPTNSPTPEPSATPTAFPTDTPTPEAPTPEPTEVGEYPAAEAPAPTSTAGAYAEP